MSKKMLSLFPTLSEIQKIETFEIDCKYSYESEETKIDKIINDYENLIEKHFNQLPNLQLIKLIFYAENFIFNTPTIFDNYTLAIEDKSDGSVTPSFSEIFAKSAKHIVERKINANASEIFDRHVTAMKKITEKHKEKIQIFYDLSEMEEVPKEFFEKLYNSGIYPIFNLCVSEAKFGFEEKKLKLIKEVYKWTDEEIIKHIVYSTMDFSKACETFSDSMPVPTDEEAATIIERLKISSLQNHNNITENDQSVVITGDENSSN